jgi:hypothetical protein
MTCKELRAEQHSDNITFYKGVFKSLEPAIIELIGTTGAGKTTFCTQFVNEEGKKVLRKTIAATGNNNVIPTEIAILENTKNRLFLKARSKGDIVRDLILVALNIDTEYKFDVNKSITDVFNKAGVKNNNARGIKVSNELYQGVYNLFRTDSLIEKFQKSAKELQLNYKNNEEIQKYIDKNITNENLNELLDHIINSELKINNFYGGRHEISLCEENILERTIIPTKTFNKYKEDNEEFHEIVSYRILFMHAILILKCDEKVIEHLPEKYKKGVVFRELQGNKKVEQTCIEADFEVINKILLIPAATSGDLVNDEIIDGLNDIIISDQKESIVVITKIDKASCYEKYTQNNYEGFIESLKEQIVTTHNNLIIKLEETHECNEGPQRFDRNAMVEKIIASFDSAYLSKITKDNEGNNDAELHKIICKNAINKEITTSDIEDVIILENYHTIIPSILKEDCRACYDWII